MSVSLTRRQPTSSTVAGKDQEILSPNVLVLQFISQFFDREKIKVQIKGRGKWYDGSAGNQICITPTNHGISFRNVKTLGAGLHSRDPTIAIHLFSRDPIQLDAMREEIDRIVITHGPEPYKGVSYILPADVPSVPSDVLEEKDDAGTLFHDIYFVKIQYYKWKQ